METELERLMVRLMGDGSSYQNMLHEAERSTGSFAAKLQVHTRSINALGVQMRGYASATTSNIAGALGLGGLIGTVTAAVSQYATREQTEIAFGALIGNAEKAEKTLRSLYKFAAETPFNAPEVLAAAKQMIAFGGTAEDIVPTMQKLGDVSAALEIPLGQLTYLYGTLKAQGRAFTMDINQFAMRGIPIWQELEKITGKSNVELRKMVEAGQVGFPLVQQAFENMTKEGGRFHGMLQKQADSIKGLFSNLQDNLGRVLADIGEEISKSIDLKGIIRDAGDFAQKVNELFKGLSPETKRMAVQIAGIGLALGGLLMLAPLIAMVFGPAFHTLLGLIGLVFSPFGLLVATVAGLGYVFLTMTETGKNALQFLGRQVDALVEHFKPMAAAIKSAIAAGDLELAFKIVVAQMRVEWARFNVFFVTYWNATKDTFLDDGYKMWNEFDKAGLDALLSLRMNWKLFFDWFLQAQEALLRGAGQHEAADQLRAIREMDAKSFQSTVEARKKSIDEGEKLRQAAASAGRAKDLEDAKADLKNLEEASNRLQLFAKVKEAFHNAFHGKDAADAAKAAVEEMPPAVMKVVPKFEAAAWNSAEAATRIAEFRDRLGLVGNPRASGPGALADVRNAGLGSKADVVTKGEAAIAEWLRKIFEKQERYAGLGGDESAEPSAYSEEDSGDFDLM